MSNEWKKLDINKCSEWPDDLLTNRDYEFEYKSQIDGEWKCDPDDIFSTLSDMKERGYEVRYRLSQPEPPTHEQIMTLWWKFGTDWKRVDWYDHHGIYRTNDGEGWTKNTFTGRKSATIPPEAE